MFWMKSFRAIFLVIVLLVSLALNGSHLIGETEISNSSDPSKASSQISPTAPFETYTAEDRGRWAYQCPRRPEIPEVRDRAWVKTPADAFVLARLEKDGLSPSRPVDRATWLRRVTFDLIGLPPSPMEIEAFVNDRRETAYEQVVDRLLASPHYGERWGQHWLDVVRYADTDGFEYDTLRPDAWRYRDYVIRSFNQDKPFDRFILEQLAGDELSPEDQDAQIAVGFNRLAAWRKNAGNQDEDMNRNEVLTEQTNAVGAVFMGTTLACARCHNHLFDPIRQSDYYRMEAFFAPAVFKEISLSDPKAHAEWEAKAKQVQEETEQIKKAMATMEQDWKARLLEAKRSQLSPAELDALSVPAERRTGGEKVLASHADFKLASTVDEIGRRFVAELKRRKKQMMAELDEAESHMPEPLPAIWTLTDDRKQIPEVHLLERGIHTAKGSRVGPRIPGVFLPDGAPERTDNAESPTTGRRLALARWLATGANPLTAPVMVNRIWQYHFGRGIVATPNDFVARGAAPTHTELLDWLAVEFVGSGWSVKAMHRLMVLSNTYQQASEGEAEELDPAGARKDPDNQLFWRFNRRRIEAEELRDAILAVSGNLNPRAGGPPVLVPVQSILIQQLYKPKQWIVTPDITEHYRRTVFLIAKRNLRLPFMEAFVAPDLQNSCARREQSTHALQCLELMNGDFSNHQARIFAGRLLKESGWNPEAIVRNAFLLAMGRDPSASEAQIAMRFLSSQRSLLKARLAHNESLPMPSWMPERMDPAAAAALCDFSLAVFNLPGFLYVN